MDFLRNNLPEFKYDPIPPGSEPSAIDIAKYKRQEAIEKAMNMGGAGVEHFLQTVNGLDRLVTYRAEVAKQLKKTGSEVEAKALEELFDYCNNQLKDYLAIL